MGTNQYFRNQSGAVTNEQRMMEDLMVEATQIYGEDVYYLVRDSEDSPDLIFGEDPISKFSRYYRMEMFVVNVENWTSGQDFFTKFGLQVNEASTFAIPRQTFNRYMPSTIMSRPREGDLIWFPLMNVLFEIKFVEHELEYFQLGKRTPMMYELRVEKYVYSDEDFDTGIDDIDDIEKDFSYIIQMDMTGGTGNYQSGETVYQGDNLSVATATAEVSEWFPSNTTMRIMDIVGIFNTGSNVTGHTSGTTYTLDNYNDLEDHIPNSDSENDIFESNANSYIVTTETNPFGMP